MGRLDQGLAAGGGEVLPHQTRGAAKGVVEVVEDDLADPFAADPGVEGAVAAEAEFDQAIVLRVVADDGAERYAGID